MNAYGRSSHIVTGTGISLVPAPLMWHLTGNNQVPAKMLKRHDHCPFYYFYSGPSRNPSASQNTLRRQYMFPFKGTFGNIRASLLLNYAHISKGTLSSGKKSLGQGPAVSRLELIAGVRFPALPLMSYVISGKLLVFPVSVSLSENYEQ